MESARSVDSGIAISIFGVAPAMPRGLLVAGRTDELPDLCVSDTAPGRRRRIVRRATAGRGRASIVVDPIDKLRGLNLLANEVGRDKSKPFAFVNRNSRAVDTSAKAEAVEFGSPGFQISEVSGGKAATLLDIEEDDRTGREPFPLRYRGCGLGIVGDALARVRLVAQLAGSRPCEKQNKTETFSTKKLALAHPGVRCILRRISKPVTGKGEIPPEQFHRVVARIVIAVKAKISTRRRFLWR